MLRHWNLLQGKRIRDARLSLRRRALGDSVAKASYITCSVHSNMNAGPPF